MANWSYSQLALYKQCPLKFYWTRVDPQPEAQRDNRRAFIGWLLGEVVAKFYLDQWWRDPSTALAKMVADLPQRSVEITVRENLVWEPGEREKWLDKATETLPKILAVIKEHQLLGPVMAVEYGMTVQISGPPDDDKVHGRIDLVIQRMDGTLVVLDLKGGGTVGKFVSADQLRLYACGILSDPRFARLPDKVGFWWARHGKVVWRKFTRENLLVFIGGVQQTIGRVRAKHFEPAPSGQCSYCEFRNRCPAGQTQIWKTRLTKTKLVSDQNAGRLDLSTL
jgi:hypothetical protein